MIPRLRPWVSYRDVLLCVDGGQADASSRFETEFCQYVGVKHSVATNMGRGALEVALQALGVGPSKEVLVPALTCDAVVESVLSIGGVPVPVDVDPATLNIDVTSLEAAAGPKTRAAVAVHTYGVPCDIRSIREACEQRGIGLVEDCAQAAGARVDGRSVGSFGDIGVFSFAFDKVLSLGSGGLAVTDNAEWAEAMRGHLGQKSVSYERERNHLLRFLRLHAMFNRRLYRFGRHLRARIESLEWPPAERLLPLGRLRRILGTRTLGHLDAIARTHRKNATALGLRLSELGLNVQPLLRGSEGAFLRLTVLVEPVHRDGLSRHMLRHGFEVIPAAYARPIHDNPRFRSSLGFRVPLDASEEACRGLLNFPTHAYMGEAAVDRMGGLVRNFVQGI